MRRFNWFIVGCVLAALAVTLVDLKSLSSGGIQMRFRIAIAEEVDIAANLEYCERHPSKLPGIVDETMRVWLERGSTLLIHHRMSAMDTCMTKKRGKVKRR